jgi:hypothetical protein
MCFDSRDSIYPAELDAPPDAIAVVLEDAKFLQKVKVFLVKTYASTYGFECHNGKLGYDGCHTY